MSKQDEADRTIFVGNLDSGAREEILFELFLQAGPLTKVHIAKDKDGRQKTYGFVCFKHTESVPYAITLLNGIRLYGRPLNLQYRSGSSHTADPSVPYLGADSTLCRAPQDNSRSPQFQDGPSSSLFLTPPYSMNNSFSSPDPYYWQAIMSSYALQQYHLNSQMLQQQQQYYQAVSQQIGAPVPQVPHFSQLQNFMARPCPPAQDSWPSWDPDQGNGRDSGGGRSVESDSDSDGRSHKFQGFSKHTYKKHKSKKKKY
ncbi:splicing regulator RBM11-like [Pristis pectinata]|uniref:splicing regulator RBM11-like n=1 Tax=Pristis pectinata TaxID=685728 RepID=UPI00223E1650|nr:splicing regulator RBM11-like [Pristis pectinata]